MITQQERVQQSVQIEQLLAQRLAKRYPQRGLSVIARPAVGGAVVRATIVLVTQDRVIQLAGACTSIETPEEAANDLFDRLRPDVSDTIRHYRV